MVCETLAWKKETSRKRAGSVAQGTGPEFKPQYYKKTKQQQKKKLALLKCGCIFETSRTVLALNCH
jgi:hypothetical protein